MCVIYNPSAGKGRARRRLERLQRDLGPRADFRPTHEPGHAEELALEAARAGFATVGAAGGDGTVHEVANGLLRAERPDVALAVFPIGSANDYAHSLGLDADWWRRHDPAAAARAVDVGVVRAPGGRQRYFVNGLGLGFNGAVTLESRRVGWLQGVPLYTVALLRALWSHYVSPPMTVTLDGETRRTPTLALSVALGRREGNFVLAPQALLDDGLFDYLHAGAIPRRRLLGYVPRMILGAIPKDDPLVRIGRCRRAAVEAESPLIVHIDGEFFCRPEDGVCSLEVELLPRRLPVRGARLPV